jgi:addiction module HigA family antidote
MPMKNPPHPRDFIRTEIIEPAGLSVTAAAAALGVARPTLSSLLNGKADLSGDMALRLEKAFGVKMDSSCGCKLHTTSPRPVNARSKFTCGGFSVLPTFTCEVRCGCSGR